VAVKGTALVHDPTGAVSVLQPSPDPDEDWWLLLALALALAVFWLYVFGLLARTVVKTRRSRDSGGGIE